jgi:hypothetical protein
MGRPRDHLAEERLRASIERDLLELQAASVAHQLAVMTDERYDSERWADRSVKTGASARWVEVAAAEVRARKEAAAGPRVVGVVMAVARMQSTPEKIGEWEQSYSSYAAGTAAIDVQPVAPALPAAPVEEPEE